MSAHSGKSAAVATPPAFTLGLMENCGGCCLDDDIPETIHTGGSWSGECSLSGGNAN